MTLHICSWCHKEIPKVVECEVDHNYFHYWECCEAYREYCRKLKRECK